MKLSSKIIQKYADSVILPPAMDGEDEVIPPSSKVPEIAPIDPEQFSHNYFIYDRDQGALEEYKKLKRKKELRELYPNLSESKLEALVNREKEQLYMTPEELGESPTFIQASKIEILSSKYGARSVMLPPPSEDVLNEEIINDPEFPELPSEEELSQMSLKPPALPNISDLDLEELSQKNNWIMFNPSDPDRAAKQDRARLEMEMAEKGRNADNSSTVPPAKKASADAVLKDCHDFYILSRK